MTDYTRYQGTHRLAADELTRITLALLREMPATRPHADDVLREALADLIAQGVGMSAEQGPGDGYRQILAVVSGVLLRLAGANVEAVKAEVVSRDATRLEGLVKGIVARLQQMAELGDPRESDDATVPPRPESGPGSPREAPVTSVPGMASPLVPPGATTEDAPNPGNTSDEASPPMRYLQGLMDDDVIRSIRNFDPDAIVHPLAESVAAPPMPLQSDAFPTAHPRTASPCRRFHPRITCTPHP